MDEQNNEKRRMKMEAKQKMLISLKPTPESIKWKIQSPFWKSSLNIPCLFLID